MTPAEYIADQRSRIETHQSEINALAPTLPSLRASWNSARKGVEDLPENASAQARANAASALEQARAEYESTVARRRALDSEVTRARGLIVEAEADPDSLTGLVRAANRDAALEGAEIDPTRDDAMTLLMAQQAGTLADIVARLVEAVPLVDISAAEAETIAHGRALLDALTDQG